MQRQFHAKRMRTSALDEKVPRRLLRRMALRNLGSDRRGRFFALAGLIVLLSLAGCSKKSGEAIVLKKDFVPARPASASPNESQATTAAEPVQAPAEEDAVSTETTTAEEETSGPALDARAVDHEQWIVTVELVADLKKIDVRVEPAQWEKLKPGDHVHLSYRQGKYTGTVWSAELK